MRKWFAEPKNLFTLLLAASVIAIVTGAYIGLYLGSRPLTVSDVQQGLTDQPPAEPVSPGLTLAASAVNVALWVLAWGAFARLCLRLSRGESAFCAATGRTLRIIGWCMAGMAAVTFLRGLPGLIRQVQHFRYATDTLPQVLTEVIVLPGVFLLVALIARILRGLLNHAMALEEAQADVV